MGAWPSFGVLALATLAAQGPPMPMADGVLLRRPHPVRQQWAQLASPGTSAALTPAQTAIPSCPSPRIDLLPLSGGRMEVVVDSQCRRFETVRLKYAGMEFIRGIDENGRLGFVLDCIAGDEAPIEFVFADGSLQSRKIVALDLNRVTKLAVIWNAPVNLDLHAFEYAALPQSPDHVWAAAPSSERDALQKRGKDKRGHGFMSTSSNGTEAGTKLEVYTFWHQPGQTSGVVNLALDYESRANQAPRDNETCGTGLYSDVEYEAVLLDRNAPAKRSFRKFASLSCSMTLSGIDRYNHKTLPQIVIRN